ncbi:MAG: PKD domain-containing protein, partial [Actinomycetes bacterium]
SGGAPNAYIVDRGVDNDTNQDTFNDGRLYEVAIPGLTGGDGGSTNQPPTVTAPADFSAAPSTTVPLGGVVSDPEGQPVTAAWTQVSGPGAAVFADAAAASTSVTFPAATGTYVLRLTGSDGVNTKADDVTVTVAGSTTTPPVSGSEALDVPVRAGSDDAEQASGGGVDLTSSDLELAVDGSKVQTVGLRFTGVTVPEGATITNAYVQFQVDEAKTAGANLTVAGQAADNPGTFTTASGNISTRQKTAATVAWAPASWPTVGARTEAQRTPDLSKVVQEIVDRPGWASGQAMAVLITGTGTRTAESFEGGAARAAALHIEYGPASAGGGDGGTTNQPPTVTAPADFSAAPSTTVP